MPISSQEVLEKFKKDFESVRSKGFISSHRVHNTGIGKTFEDMVNVIENNKQEVDYLNELELKSSRELSGSMITLFTKSPSFPEKANTLLRLKFGKDENGLKILHTTIPGGKFNTFLNKYGFKLDIDKHNKTVCILVKNLESGDLIDFNCYYKFDDLKNIVEKKCKNIAFITAQNKVEEGKEFFHFQKAVLLTGLTFEKFLEGIEAGIIFYDIRIGAYKSGKNMGKTHDHGSGFRIKKEDVSKLFNTSEI